MSNKVYVSFLLDPEDAAKTIECLLGSLRQAHSEIDYLKIESAQLRKKLSDHTETKPEGVR